MKIWPKKLVVYILIFILGGIPNSFVTPTNAQTTEILPTSVSIELACGDGFWEIPEICDPGDESGGLPPDTGTTTCSNFNDIYGNPFVSGTLGCLTDCSYFSTTTCYTCGNGNKEQPEECDGSDFGGQTCESFGLAGGDNLICSAGCLLSLSDCESLPEEGGGYPASSRGGGSSGSTSGFQPGADAEVDTRVKVSGKAYPGAEVHILADGVVIGIAECDTKADFDFETTEVPAGVNSFGFWSEDKDGIKSTLLTLTLRVISGAVTTISGVYLSPSIDTDKKAVDQGEPILIYGQTVPETEVHIYIHSEEEIVETTNSEDTGTWILTLDTTELSEDFHTAKAFFQLEVEGNIIRSGFSRSVSFYVGSDLPYGACPGADLNEDGNVNLTDFSILLYYWGTDNECADQDSSGNVDLIDFSIMMFYWTG